MIDYPKTMPVDALMLMLDKVRGNPVSTPEMIQGAWNVAGYGLSLALPIPAVIGEAGDLSDEAALEQLIAHASDPQVAGFGILPAIAISMAIKLALKLLSEYIN